MLLNLEMIANSTGKHTFKFPAIHLGGNGCIPRKSWNDTQIEQNWYSPQGTSIKIFVRIFMLMKIKDLASLY